MTLTTLQSEAQKVMNNLTENFSWKDEYEIDPNYDLPKKYIIEVIEGEEFFEKCKKRYDSYPISIQNKISNTLESVRDSFVDITE